VRPDPRPVQPSTVLARSRTLCAGSAGAAACAAASLTAAARGALPEGRSGRRDSRSDRTKGCCYWPELKSAPHHDQFAELDAHRSVAVSAEVIVTGDKDLLALSRYQSIRILTARTFLMELGG